MKTSTACPLIWLLAATTLGQEREAYVSEASFIVGTYQPADVDHTPAGMAAAANKFLQSLDDELRAKVSHTLDSPERRAWTNLPAQPDAGGVRLGELKGAQVRAACDLMRSLLSEQGYRKMCQIMLADDQLLPNGRPRPGFGTETFSVVVFGAPSESGPWAFQLDGHHIGLNAAVTGEAVTLSPSFIGTQPEGFTLSGNSFRPLAGEVDTAFELARSLTEEQFRKALVGPRRGQLVSGPGTDGRVPAARGIAASQLDESQQRKLLSLIAHWTGNLPPPHAEKRLQQLRREIGNMHFAWNGPREPGSDMSYAIFGPSLVIEYACQDLGGNPLEHLHTMYRDPTNEYGGQLKD